MATHHQTVTQKLSSINEQTWISIGTLAESMNEPDKALAAYESALRHHPYSIPALTQIAALCRSREMYPKAIEYFNRILQIDQNNGEVWGALGHCYLMSEDLQLAYQAYQQALYHLPNPKEPKLWYGIGILYDRYGSYEHAEEAFSAVIRMEPKFEKANEIYFRLGIIYKQQGKYDLSLQCFRYILNNPPKPLTEMDIYFQIGHVHEQQKEFDQARQAYERVLAENPSHAKVLQQLGWLYHQQNASFANQELAISFLSRSLESDPSDAQTWYLLGRCYMAQQKYNKAYDAYQQAVYRDGRNPTFWCSIGVLYYQINQYRDALDAYSRAIRLNPYISEVWYDLGTLYESCNNQISDAMDAYQRALELDPNNPHVKQRLTLLRQAQAQGAQVPPPAGPGQHPQNPMGYGGQAQPGQNGFYQGPPQQLPGAARPPPMGPPGPLGPPGPMVGPPGNMPSMANQRPPPPQPDPRWGAGMAPPQSGGPARAMPLGPGPMQGQQPSPRPDLRRGGPGMGGYYEAPNSATPPIRGPPLQGASPNSQVPPAHIAHPPPTSTPNRLAPAAADAHPSGPPTTTHSGLDVMAAAALSGLGQAGPSAQGAPLAPAPPPQEAPAAPVPTAAANVSPLEQLAEASVGAGRGSWQSGAASGAAPPSKKRALDDTDYDAEEAEDGAASEPDTKRARGSSVKPDGVEVDDKGVKAELVVE